MSMNTTSANRAFLPEQVHDLIVVPVTREAIALQVADVVPVNERANGYRVPIVNADPSAAWTAEGEEITPSDSNLGEVHSPFFKLAGLTIISAELAADSSPEASELVGNGLARDIATKLDAAFFGTKDTSTVQPAGLADLTGVHQVDAGAGWKNSDPFAEAVYAAEGEGATLSAFVANPADALALAKVKKATGSNEPLLGNDPTQPTRRMIAGVPLLVSPAVATGTIWGTPKNRTVVAMRQGTTLDVDHSVYFTSDRVAVRATMRVALLFPHEAAIQKITLTPGG